MGSQAADMAVAFFQKFNAAFNKWRTTPWKNKTPFQPSPLQLAAFSP
jgi:hypothetical protein